MTDSDVNAVESLGVIRSGIVESSLLVDDGVDGDCSLSSLSVTDDQLSLASSNGNLLLQIVNNLIKLYLSKRKMEGE